MQVCKFKIVLNIHVGTLHSFCSFSGNCEIVQSTDCVQHRKETQCEEIDGVVKTQQASLT